MKKIGIIVDGSTTLTDKDFKRLDVNRVYFRVFNTKTNEEFTDGNIDIDYIKKTHEQGIPFKTSCTPPGEVLDKIEEMLKEYETIIIFPMCQGISSQANNMKLYAEDYPGKVFVATPKMMNTAIDYFVERVRELEKEGKTTEEILKIIDEESNNVGTVFTCQSWKTMAGSGRFHSMVGNILDKLGLCPIICLQYESPKFYGMCKNFQKTIEKMVNKFMKENDVENIEDIEILALYDSLLEDQYKKMFIDYLCKKFNIEEKDVPIKTNPKAITVYTGINAVGVTLKIKNKKPKSKKK